MYMILYRITNGDDIHGMVAMTTSDCPPWKHYMIETSTFRMLEHQLSQFMYTELIDGILVSWYTLVKIYHQFWDGRENMSICKKHYQLKETTSAKRPCKTHFFTTSPESWAIFFLNCMFICLHKQISLIIVEKD